MTELWVADSGIRQLHARFSDAVWRQDADEFAGCFAADGEWKIAGLHMRGRDEIAEACRNLLGRCKRIHLIVGLPILEVGDGTAIGRLSMTELTLMGDGSTAMTVGFYHDRYVEEGGRWLFRHRHWSFKYRGPPDLTGVFVDTPDYGAFPARPADDEETYVRKA
ncbi:MAG: nuclear transport factor 2 family protein [Novosphingobium sp.]